MTISQQIITLSANTNASNSTFTVSGVFWLTAPTNSVIPLPFYRSIVPGISLSDLSILRSGTSVEQAFTSVSFASGTTQAQIDTELLNEYTVAQGLLNSSNPVLTTITNRAYNGSTWNSVILPTVKAPLSNYAVNSIRMDIGYGIAFGLVPNMTANRMAGYVATSSTTFTKIRATTYTPQGTNAQRSIVSTSASDAAAGTGARTVVINYLNTSMIMKQDTINLNGTTAVNTNATDIAFIESMIVTVAGTNLSNVGTINIMTGTAGTGTAWGSIAANDSQTFWAHHYVQTGVTCYLLNVAAGSSVVAGRSFIIHTGNPTVANLPQIGIGGFYGHSAGGPSDEHEFGIPLSITGPDFIVMEDLPITATASVAFGTIEYIEF